MELLTECYSTFGVLNLGERSRGKWLVDYVLCVHAAYRTQLFCYLKACGREELNTMNLWGALTGRCLGDQSQTPWNRDFVLFPNPLKSSPAAPSSAGPCSIEVL